MYITATDTSLYNMCIESKMCETQNYNIAYVNMCSERSFSRDYIIMCRAAGCQCEWEKNGMDFV